MTHNQNTQPIQCHYVVSKQYINSVSTDIHVESPHFPIYLQIKYNYFKVKLENDLYLPVSHYELKTKAQSLENIHQQKLQQFKNNTHPQKIIQKIILRKLSSYSTPITR